MVLSWAIAAWVYGGNLALGFASSWSWGHPSSWGHPWQREDVLAGALLLLCPGNRAGPGFGALGNMKGDCGVAGT